MNDAKPAATLVLLRETRQGLETLLLRRNSKLKFAGGSWVFPGGKLDTADIDKSDNELQAAQYAAIRETQEECGLQIAASGLQMISHWTTPEGSPKRYATWFFMAEYAATGDVVVDGSEITDFLWERPAIALERYRTRQIELMPPAFITLSELQEFSRVEQAREFFENRPIPNILPKVSFHDEQLCMLYPGDSGYDQGDPAVAGPKHRCVMIDGLWNYCKESWNG